MEAVAAPVRAAGRDRGRGEADRRLARFDVSRHARGPRRAAARAARLPDVLLGWVGADRFPVVVPAGIGGCDERGIRLMAPLLPPGGRRAGLTAHWFSRGTVGQNQRKHTGWLEVGADGV